MGEGLRNTGAPRPSVVVGDRRPGDRSLRVTWHPDTSTVVFSHWVEGLCVASTRVALKDAEAVLAFLASSLPVEAVISSE